MEYVISGERKDPARNHVRDVVLLCRKGRKRDHRSPGEEKGELLPLFISKDKRREKYGADVQTRKTVRRRVHRPKPGPDTREKRMGLFGDREEFARKDGRPEQEDDAADELGEEK